MSSRYIKKKCVYVIYVYLDKIYKIFEWLQLLGSKIILGYVLQIVEEYGNIKFVYACII